MSAAVPLRADWFGPGWGWRLLPHYRWRAGGLETLGGRPIPLSAAERRVAHRCDGAIWCPAEDAHKDVEAMDSLGGLILRRLILPMPTPIRSPAGGAIDLVLSPHIDDAALSLGARITTLNRPVLVFNIFSRQSYQTGLRIPPDRLDAIAREEDRLASEILGYRSLYAGLAGAQDRHRLRLGEVIGCDPAQRRIEERLRKDGGQMLALLAEMLDTIAKHHEVEHLYAPAGVGGHLDHLVVRRQAFAIADRLGIRPGKVRFYEDMPYATFARPGYSGSNLSAIVSADLLARKHAALLAFATRLRMTEIAATMAFAVSVGGERWWGAGEDQAASLASLPAFSRR